MFIKKLACGIIGGLILWIIVVVAPSNEGKTWGENFSMIPAAILLGIILVLWFTRNMADEGNDAPQPVNRQISKLQDQLRSTLDTAASYEASGDHVKAGQMRGYAAVIESQLRNLGA